MEKHVRALFLLLLLLVIGRPSPELMTRPAAIESDSISAKYLRSATSAEASVLVEVRGSGVCTGAKVANTRLVITAAHCVVEKRTGLVGSKYDLRVERGDTRYDIESVLVNWTWGPKMDSANDVAILVMSEEVPGPGVLVADHYAGSAATMIGFQPLKGDGTWLRGKNYDDLVHPKDASPGITYVESTPAACSVSSGDVKWTKQATWDLPCGMVPGASGGPVVVRESNGEFTLVGVISAVNFSLSRNFIAPLEKVRTLLDSPDAYRKDLAVATPAASNVYLK